MPRPTCREDLYEERVKAIFKTLRKSAEDDGDELNSEWLATNLAEVGNVFLDDVQAYMGLPFGKDDE